MIYDEYRVSLFKKKLREILPDMNGLRFERSKGKCHLVIAVAWRYTKKHAEQIGAYIMHNLTENGIEAKVERDRFGLHYIFNGPETVAPLDCICIPIDQAALPERKRSLRL